MEKDVLRSVRANYIIGDYRRKHLAKCAEVEARQAKMPAAAANAERWRRLEAMDDNQDVQARSADGGATSATSPRSRGACGVAPLSMASPRGG
ncbi:hypothetical protein [Sphingopyxis sp. H115]|uniref:hypothetical protein n=1 Tax=Sphingopyxis sp. H115 TaxID=1759073 RepID=UPI000A6F536B|nr:hypothetical protein [Sphingopyxis sp. H115]